MFISVGWLAGYFKTLYHPVMLGALSLLIENWPLTVNTQCNIRVLNKNNHEDNFQKSVTKHMGVMTTTYCTVIKKTINDKTLYY